MSYVAGSDTASAACITPCRCYTTCMPPLDAAFHLVAPHAPAVGNIVQVWSLTPALFKTPAPAWALFAQSRRLTRTISVAHMSEGSTIFAVCRMEIFERKDGSSCTAYL